MYYPIPESCKLIKPSVSDCCVAATVVHSLAPLFIFDGHYINSFTVVDFSIDDVHLGYAHSQNTSYAFTGDRLHLSFNFPNLYQFLSGFG